MDAADVLEQRKLRQGFALATLVSTVAGTFITGINLYDRLVEQRRQRKLDKGQNKKILELEQRLDESRTEAKRFKEGGGKGDNGRDDDLRGSLERSGNTVQHEYDRCLGSMGPKFAQGDLIAQTQIQSQIILLQGTVIKLLEESILTGRPPDISKLYNTSEFAREGSIRALHDQYQRLLQAAPPQRRPTGPMRRTSSTPSLRDRPTGSVWSGRRPPQNTLTYHNHGPLFCRGAEELQHPSRPLDHSLAPCPACGAGGDGPRGCQPWRIEKEVAVRGLSARQDRRPSRGGSDDGSETIVVRSYVLTARFIFKCHREGSGYACYLCFCQRDRDTLCRSEEGLVNHITSKHSSIEYEGDSDIKELDRRLLCR